MARGWESKSIESQQDDAARRPPSGRDTGPIDRERITRRGGLELALAQTQADLGVACRPAHRDMLRLRLDAIRQQLLDVS